MTRFASDEDLRYAVEARVFEPGQAVQLDPDYRLKHLPLVNPDHPDVIRRDEGSDYVDGRYRRARVSLVLFLPPEALAASPAFQALTTDLEASRLAPKVAWAMAHRRAALLHATVVAGLEARLDPPAIETLVDRLDGWPPFEVQVRGPWVGARANVGRIYLPLYPEMRDGEDCLAAVQRALDGPLTRFYAAGLHNLTDHLTATEAAELAAIVRRYRDEVLVTLPVERLDLVAVRDDLILDSEVLRTVTLGSG